MNQESRNKNLKNKLLEFHQELKKVCERCGRMKDSVEVVYATKYLDKELFVSFLEIARGMGIEKLSIGENRVQDAERKFRFVERNNERLLRGVRKMMIGNLQKNKINKALDLFDEIQSVESMELAKAIDERLTRAGKIIPVYLEVNISGEESKHGFTVEEIGQDYKFLKSLKFLKISGLMAMAPYVDDPEETRPYFKELRQLADRFGLKTSMGMSNDWKIAVEEGADVMRVGRRIFHDL